jgi:tRNA A-37 threonylcarbamoyl transferase component Bud32
MADYGLENIIEMSKTMKDSGRIADSEYYFKNSAKRSPQRRHENDYSILDEYNNLQDMYEIAPENVVEPICMVYNKQNDPIGYVMKYSGGKPLSKLGLNYRPSHIEKQLNETVEKLHKNHVTHGDLFEFNMLVEGKNIKLIDPAGCPKDCYNLEQDKKLDNYLKDVMLKMKYTEKERDNPDGEATLRRMSYSLFYDSIMVFSTLTSLKVTDMLHRLPFPQAKQLGYNFIKKYFGHKKEYMN